MESDIEEAGGLFGELKKINVIDSKIQKG